MEDQKTTNSTLHQTLGVISLIIGILGLLFSFIPCLGALAIYLSSPAFICGVIAIYFARKANASITLSVAGVVLSIIGIVISIMQFIQVSAINDVLKK